MGKLTEQMILQRSTMANKHEEMLNICGHKGNGAQIYIEITLHPMQNGCHQ
jgi:hypothetical protein